MKYSHRFFLWAPIAVLVALLAAAVIHWFAVANAVSKYLDAANGHEIAPGVALHYAHRQIAGFPFRIDLQLDDMKIDVAARRGPAEWRTEHFALHMLDYGRFQAIYEAAGKQTVSWTNSKGAREVLQFTPGLLRASSINAHGRLSRFDMQMIAAGSKDFQAANLEFHLRRNPDADALDIVLSADDLHVSPKFQSAFGSAIRKLRFNAQLHPASSLRPLLSGQREWREALSTWNGALDISNLDIAWGKSEATGSGRLTLDNAHRPQGILNLKVAGLSALQAQAGNGFFATLLNSIARNGHDKVQIGFKSGLAFANDTPAGFLDPLY